MKRFELFGFHQLVMVFLFTVSVFGCGGGGCSGCEGCGVQPIPGAFPLAHRIDNSAQVRLSESGIDFIETNADAIVNQFLPTGLDFPIPPVDTTTSIAVVGNVRIRVCSGGNCNAHAEIRSLQLTPTPANTLVLRLEVRLDTRNDAGARASLPIRLGPNACVLGVCAIDTTCQADIDTRRGSRDYIALQGNIAFVADTRPARMGYTRVEVSDLALAPGADIEDADITFGSCSGIVGAIINAVSGLLRGTLVDQLEDQLSGVLDDAVADQLCTTQGEFGCPTGTCASDADPGSTCYFDSAPGGACTPGAECVPMLLGTDGRGDLGGAFLGGFSPGTHAYGQFLLAAGGDGVAVNNGMSLFFYGGFMGTDRTFTTTPAHHPCVPIVEPPAISSITIPRTNAFQGNVIPGSSTTAHVGIGIAEDYMNYAGYGMFDSGMLCIGAGTRLSQQLSTGLVSALIMSLNDLTLPSSNAPLTVAVRPQLPPQFTIGTTSGQPLLGIVLPQVQVDFYVWSTERYVRFMTFQTDIVVDVNLRVEAGEIVPEITRLEAANSSVTNSELLSEDAETLANTLQTLIGSFAGMLTSGLSPIALPDLMGFQLNVPEGGILGVEEGSDRFLGIFANLALAGPAPLTAPVETTLEVSDLSLDQLSMDPATWAQGEGNTVWLHFDAQGPMGVDYEYSYRIDGGLWSPWTRDRRLRIDDDVLLLQARHQIEARARVAGEPQSMDGSPAMAELLVDILPPRVTLERTGEGVSVHAEDVITAQESLQYRHRVAGGEWSEWSLSSELSLPYDDALEVEVKDEAGNVGQAQLALIRGLPNAASGSGCGCSAPGTGGSSLPLGLLALVALGALGVRRRRRFLGPILSAGLALGAGALASGCDCGGAPIVMPDGSVPPTCATGCMPASPPGDNTGSICCESSNMCVDYDLTMLCPAGSTCAVTAVAVDPTSCAVTCSNCMAQPALEEGQLATYLDFALDETGSSAVISGYSPGYSTRSSQRLYGDLVVGQWNGTEVTWDVVDGAPSEPVTNDPAGWRGGVSAPGDDVGRWTSIARRGTEYVIAYYDLTNGALKVAIGSPGSWTTHTVDDQDDSGRYASLVLLADGTPVISYLRIGLDSAAPTQVLSSVQVARASSPSPTGPTSWTITEVASAPMACRQEYCGAGTSCIEEGQCITPTSDCSSACASDETCFNGSCRTAIPEGYVEDMPPAMGLYTSLAATSSGLALVYYDRSTGNLMGAAFDGTAWGTPFLIDGYGRNDPNVGDSGQGANLFVDSSDAWHVAYIDGAEETLRYATIVGGAVMTREVVDDGSTSDGTTRHADGRHIVGDDASIVVTESGQVRIAYQDATAHTGVVATRPGGGGPWSIQVFDAEAYTGYWIEQQLLGTTSYVLRWWRDRDGRNTSNGVRISAVN